MGVIIIINSYLLYGLFYRQMLGQNTFRAFYESIIIGIRTDDLIWGTLVIYFYLQEIYEDRLRPEK